MSKEAEMKIESMGLHELRGRFHAFQEVLTRFKDLQISPIIDLGDRLKEFEGFIKDNYNESLYLIKKNDGITKEVGRPL